MRTGKILTLVTQVIAIAMVVYQLAYTQLVFVDPMAHRIIHLGFSFLVVFLFYLQRSKRNATFGVILLVASLITTLYLLYFLNAILLTRTAIPWTSDLIVGGVVMFLAFAGCYLLFGKVFPLLGAAFLIYLYFGRYLPYPLTVAPVSITRIMVWLSTPGTEEGIFGNILALSANYLFLFIFFGSALSVFGGLRFIMGVSRWIGSKFRSGPALTALLGSSLLGTVTGSTVANITITGAYTIPLMKSAGYRPEQAGAIEAVSSNGGQIMPPIMGATAFVMAGFAGIPYFDIMIAAILPALVYYFGALLYVQLTAQKMAVKAKPQPVNGKELLLDLPTFILPMAVLVYCLLRGYSLPFVGFWAIMTLVFVGLVSNLWSKEKFSLKKALEHIPKGVETACEMAVICALIGVIATCIEVSGLGMKLPLIIQNVSGGHLIVGLMIAMASSILAGMGVPTVVAYLLVATGAVPALLAMGVPLLQAHFFCFICAVFSHITPPVAIGALIAARLAVANFWSTCWEAVKAGFAAFLLPFFIIYTPILHLWGARTVLPFVQLLAILLGIVGLQIALTSYCLTRLGPNRRAVFLASAVGFFLFAFLRHYLFFLAGFVLFPIGVPWRFMRKTQTVVV